MIELPTFIVPGAQKSGTTWLFECLDEHPEIYVPRQKELHYFCPMDECRFSTCDKGLTWYRERFPDAENIKAAGDLSTDYMYYPGIARQLYDLNKNLKIIFLLRNPVDRSYSAYWMWRRHKSDLPPFKTMIANDSSLVRRGYYFRQVLPFIKLFGMSQVRIYIYEEITKQPEIFFKDIFQTISVDPTFVPRTMNKKVAGTKNYPRGLDKIVYKLGSKIINTPLLQSGWRELRRKTNVQENILGWFGYDEGKQSYPEMGVEDRKSLQELYRKENSQLIELLERGEEIWPDTI